MFDLDVGSGVLASPGPVEGWASPPVAPAPTVFNPATAHRDGEGDYFNPFKDASDHTPRRGSVDETDLTAM